VPDVEHIVEQGDCLASIAAKYKWQWQTLWNHPQNAALRQKRKNPNVLYPGDVVNIPDKSTKTQDCATGEKHVFQTSGATTLFKVRLLEDGQPRQNVSYTLQVDQLTFTGTTDSQGTVVHKIPAAASQATLMTPEDTLTFELGKLDPIEEDSGISHRLRNLGLLHADETSESEDMVSEAVREFQQQQGLPVTGEVDDMTRQKLAQAHGS
jgi:peptidoglycan hydrolase-like protein with peptidoglycan-binding domain